MHCAICWNHLLSMPITCIISSPLQNGLLYGNNIGNGMQSAGNQRYFKKYPVGTSETTRATNSFPYDEWLAGVIDGDGYLYVTKEGHVGLEITMDLYDEPCFTFIKTGGSVKRRSNSRSYRYRTQSRQVVFSIVSAQRLKALVVTKWNNLYHRELHSRYHIRNSVRIPQLQAICKQLSLPFKQPGPLTSSSDWLAGFWDAEGIITYSMKTSGKHLIPQLSIRFTSKHGQDLEPILETFGSTSFTRE